MSTTQVTPAPTSPSKGGAYENSIEEIRALIRGIEIKNLRGSFMGMDFEAEFEQRTGDLARQTESIPLPDPPPIGIVTDDLQRLPSLVGIAPAAAIMEARSLIDMELSRIASSRALTEEQPFRRLQLRQMLIDEGQISPGISALIDDLRLLGNVVAHRSAQDTVTEKSAQNYIGMATRVIEASRQITG